MILAHPPWLTSQFLEFMLLQGLLILQEFISYIIKSSTNSIYRNIAYFIKHQQFLQKNTFIVDLSFFCQAQVQVRIGWGSGGSDLDLSYAIILIDLGSVGVTKLVLQQESRPLTLIVLKGVNSP